MKRFTKAVKMAAAVLSLCVVTMLGITAEAAPARYANGATYVNPDTNSKNEYYSDLKIRMSTYSESSIEVVYPAGATFDVTTNKKAMEATVIGKELEQYGWDDMKVYVTPTSTESVAYYDYYDSEEGYTYQKYCYYDEEVGRYYIYVWVGDDLERMYVNPYFKTVAYYTAPGSTVSYRLSQDSTGYYYEKSVYRNQQAVNYPDGSRYEYSKAYIQLNSTKAGTYKVNVLVNGVKTTLKVYVTTYGGNVRKGITVDGKTVKSVSKTGNDKKMTEKSTTDYQVKKALKSAKLKVSADKGIKITGLVVASINENGKVVYKKAKNGSKVNFSQDYHEKTKNYLVGDSSRAKYKWTGVYVSYKDKYLGTSCKYTIVKKHGEKQIKCVYKGRDGKKSVYYYDFYNGSTFDVWSY